MALLEGWFFVSKDERARRQKEMATRIFPFGEEEQRSRAAAVLKELFGGGKKHDEQGVLFCFISGKNEYILNGEGSGGRMAASTQLKRIGWKKPERVELLLAFIELETATRSMADYPEAEDVRSKVAQI
jgi:hypothetical protein